MGRITGTQPAPPTASNCPDPYITGAFNAGGAATSGPTITDTTVAGGGAATSPVAAAGGGTAPGATAASGGAGAASGASGNGTAGGSSTTATTKAPVSTTTTTAAVAAAPGQTPGEAMSKASSQLLGIPGLSLVVVVATLLFLGLLAVPPLVGLTRKRRVDAADEESSRKTDA